MADDFDHMSASQFMDTPQFQDRLQQVLGGGNSGPSFGKTLRQQVDSGIRNAGTGAKRAEGVYKSPVAGLSQTAPKKEAPVDEGEGPDDSLKLTTDMLNDKSSWGKHVELSGGPSIYRPGMPQGWNPPQAGSHIETGPGPSMYRPGVPEGWNPPQGPAKPQ